jgi:colanic acid/amylovoran biosynthesis glycosyltransferase
MPRSTSIAVIVPPGEKISSALVERELLGLLDHGWDAHLLYERDVRPEEHSWEAFHERLHRGWDTFPPSEIDGRSPASETEPRLRGRIHNGDAFTDELLPVLKPQLVHFHSASSAHERIDVVRAVGSRIVVSFDGRDIARANGESSYHRAVLEAADAVQLPEHELWEEAVRRGCPADKKRAAISYAVDLAVFAGSSSEEDAARSADGRLRILSVGALDWAQGYEHALQAVRLLLDRGVDCVYRIVGSGEYADTLGFARHQLGVASATEVLAPGDLESLRGHMAWAHVYLCPAVVDGISHGLVLAQTMALPVVATHGRAGTRKLVAEETGFVVPRRDPAVLAEKLELLRDEVRRRRMGRAARRAALERFTMETRVAGLDKLYRLTLAG